MIKVTFKTSDDFYKGFTVTGHAGYADKGKDIVCAAVSALVINTINSLESLTDDAIKVNSDDDKGLIELEFLSLNSVEAKLLIESLILGLKGIKDSDNGKYICIYFKEV